MLEIDTNLGGTATLDIIIKEPENLVTDEIYDDQERLIAHIDL